MRRANRPLCRQAILSGNSIQLSGGRKMRKSLLTALLGFALLAAPVAFSTKSDAANPLRQNAPAANNRPTPLPNYDIRLDNRDEFDDTELNTNAGRQRAAGSANA